MGPAASSHLSAGRFGGWSIYFKDGKPIYAYNFLGLQRFSVAAAQAAPAGKATICFEFAYDGGGLAKGGLGSLFVNDTKIAEGRIERTQPMVFSADETTDVGEDDATPVTEDYKAYDNKFTGRILKVTVDVKPMGEGEGRGEQGLRGNRREGGSGEVIRTGAPGLTPWHGMFSLCIRPYRAERAILDGTRAPFNVARVN